jgi:hypothetical protein
LHDLGVTIVVGMHRPQIFQPGLARVEFRATLRPMFSDLTLIAMSIPYFSRRPSAMPSYNRSLSLFWSFHINFVNRQTWDKGAKSLSSPRTKDSHRRRFKRTQKLPASIREDPPES